MYYHLTKFQGFALFYLVKPTLTSYDFNIGESLDMPSIPFTSLECPLSCSVFKVLENQPSPRIFWFQIIIFCCKKSIVKQIKNRLLFSVWSSCAKGPGSESHHHVSKKTLNSHKLVVFQSTQKISISNKP